MPCLKIHTNLRQRDIPMSFAERMAPILAANIEGKKEEQFIIMISGDCMLHMFGDNTTPAAVACLESIGGLGVRQNKKLMKKLAEYVEAELNIIPGRFFLTMYDVPDYILGIFGTTADTL